MNKYAPVLITVGLSGIGFGVGWLVSGFVLDVIDARDQEMEESERHQNLEEPEEEWEEEWDKRVNGTKEDLETVVDRLEYNRMYRSQRDDSLGKDGMNKFGEKDEDEEAEDELEVVEEQSTIIRLTASQYVEIYSSQTQLERVTLNYDDDEDILWVPVTNWIIDDPEDIIGTQLSTWEANDPELYVLNQNNAALYKISRKVYSV